MGPTPTVTYFCFVGGQGVPNRTVTVRNADLDSKPDSLLSRLASKTWNYDEGSGKTVDKPIETHPMAEDSPIRDFWQPSMSEMIVPSYLRFSDSTTKIPFPTGAHIESVIWVLEFYGFHVPSPLNYFDFDGIAPVAKRLQVRLQAHRFVNCKEECRKIVERAVLYLENNLQAETRFQIIPGSRYEPHGCRFYSKFLGALVKSKKMDSTKTDQFKAELLKLFESKGFDSGMVVFETQDAIDNRLVFLVNLDPVPSSDRDQVSGGTKRQAERNENGKSKRSCFVID